MKPIELAAEVYRREPCARTFREDLEAHLLHGWVFSTPQAFGMIREVPAGAAQTLVTNPWVTWDAAHCDAWLVYLAAGDIKSLIPYFPHPHKFIGFERSNILRWHPFAAFTRRLAKCTTLSTVLISSLGSSTPAAA